MSSTPKCLQNPRLRLLPAIGDEKGLVAERLGPQHYLIWRSGSAVTEVRCVRGRWYWRGSGMSYETTRAQAIFNGKAAKQLGRRLDRKPLEDWSPEALKAGAAEKGEA